MKTLLLWANVMRHQPIAQLITSPELNGALVRKRTVEVKRKNGGKMSVGYFTLNQQSSPLFRRVHNTLRRGQLVSLLLEFTSNRFVQAGFSALPNQSSVFVIPNGELSSLLGLPCHDFPTFHCLFFHAQDSNSMEYSLEANSLDL